MFNLRHFLHGQKEFTLSAPFPQRLLNLCANQGLLFWGLEWHTETAITVKIPASEEQHFLKLVAQVGGATDSHISYGLPQFLGRFRHRVGFMIGFTCSLLTVLFLSQFILVIEITGAEKISHSEIRNALERAGLTTGVYGPSLALSHLAQVVMADLDGISWISVNLYGTKAEVLVREATAPPEIAIAHGLYDVVAEVDGMIEEMQVYKGEKMVAVGDTVVAGQVLLSGNVELEPPLYSEYPSQWLTVPASGKIWARTWRSLTAVIPETALVKDSTGDVQRSYSLTFFRQSWNFFENSVFFLENYDKLKTSYALPLFPQFPMSVSYAEESSYSLVEMPLNIENSQKMLEKTLIEELEFRMGEGGEIIAMEFSASVKNGLLLVTLTAECREEIGKMVEGSPISEELEESGES